MTTRLGPGSLIPALTVILVLAACGSLPVDQSSESPTLTASPASASPGGEATPSPAASLPAPPAVIQATALPLELPDARSRAVAFVFGNEILVCGGLLANGTTTDSIVSIDTQTLRVTSSGALAARVHDAAAASLAGLALIFGGGSAAPSSVVQRVDANAGSTIVGSLPAARADLSAVTIGTDIFVLGGGPAAHPDRSVLSTVDGIHFESVATLAVGVRYGAAVAFDRVAYLIGGVTPSGETAAIQAFDLRSGSVSVVANLPHPLSHAVAFVLGGQILVAGGREAGRRESELWRFDPLTGAVTALSPLPYALSDAAAVVVGGVGYLIGGEGVAGLLTSVIAVTAG